MQQIRFGPPKRTIRSGICIQNALVRMNWVWTPVYGNISALRLRGTGQTLITRHSTRRFLYHRVIRRSISRRATSAIRVSKHRSDIRISGAISDGPRISLSHGTRTRLSNSYTTINIRKPGNISPRNVWRLKVSAKRNISSNRAVRWEIFTPIPTSYIMKTAILRWTRTEM